MFLNFYLKFGFTYFCTYHFRKIHVCISKKNTETKLSKLFLYTFLVSQVSLSFLSLPLDFVNAPWTSYQIPCCLKSIPIILLSPVKKYLLIISLICNKTFMSHSSWVDKVAKISKKLTTHHNLFNLRDYGFFSIINTKFSLQ